MPFKKRCELLSLNRSTAHYQLNQSKSAAKESEDLTVKDEIENIQLEFPYYGYRMITAELKRRNWHINKKKIQRIMQKYGLKSQIRRLFKSFTDSRHKLPRYPNLIKDLIVSCINQVWGADITYVRLKNDFLYLAVIIDFYSRKRIWIIR